MKLDHVITVAIAKKRASPAWAVIDPELKLVRMHAPTRALAIFDTRRAARECARRDGGKVVPVYLSRKPA